MPKDEQSFSKVFDSSISYYKTYSEDEYEEIKNPIPFKKDEELERILKLIRIFESLRN